MAEERSPILFEDETLGRGFGMIPARVLFDKELSAGAKAMYCALWYWGHNGDRTAPSQADMAEEFGGGRRTVQRHLSNLEEAGYVKTRRVGLGKPNEYVIVSLNKLSADAPKMAHQVRHQRRNKDATNGASLERRSEVTTQNLSHNGDALAAEFFERIGETKPSRTRRESAVEIITELTAEGFDEPTLREAVRIAAERGARSPKLLPHVVGEAHEIVQTRGKRKAQADAITAMDKEQRAEAEERFSEELQAVDALPAGERQRLERECRERLPAGISEGMAKAILPGMIAARLRETGKG